MRWWWEIIRKALEEEPELAAALTAHGLAMLTLGMVLGFIAALVLGHPITLR